MTRKLSLVITQELRPGPSYIDSAVRPARLRRRGHLAAQAERPPCGHRQPSPLPGLSTHRSAPRLPFDSVSPLTLGAASLHLWDCVHWRENRPAKGEGWRRCQCGCHSPAPRPLPWNRPCCHPHGSPSGRCHPVVSTQRPAGAQPWPRPGGGLQVFLGASDPSQASAPCELSLSRFLFSVQFANNFF